MAAAPFDELYGIEIETASGDEARGRVPVSDAVRQPAGLVHGGVYASMAESLAVAATQVATGRVAVAHSSQTSFLRPITDGAVQAAGRPRHRGRTTWVWEFDFTDDDGRLCAIVRMTVAVRDSVQRRSAGGRGA